jgi:hypothetical protein
MWLVALKLQGVPLLCIFRGTAVIERPLRLSYPSFSCQMLGFIVLPATCGGNNKTVSLAALDRALCCVAILHTTIGSAIFSWFILAAYDNLKPSRKLS